MKIWKRSTPTMPKEFYRSNLPHWSPRKASFFVTFRLKGSLPIFALKQLREAYESHQKQKTRKESEGSSLHKSLFSKYDKCLDTHAAQNNVLSDSKIANIVAQKIKSLN